MARENRLQRQQREEQERLERFNLQQAEYGPLLMEALHRFSQLPGSLKVGKVSSQYVFTAIWDEESGDGATLRECWVQNWVLYALMRLEGDYDNLKAFISEIEQVEAAMEKQRQREDLKKNALGKLTPEEREALGL